MRVTDEGLRTARKAILRPIFAALDERGAPRAWLARQTGVSARALWTYEHGTRRPPPAWIDRSGAVLGVPTAPIHAALSFLRTPRVRETVDKRNGGHSNGGGTSERDKPNDDTTPRRGRRTA